MSKGNPFVICSMKKKFISQSASFKLRVLIATSVVFLGVVFVLFATANPSTGRELPDASPARSSFLRANVTARTIMRVTPEGVVRDYNLQSKRGFVAASMTQRRMIRPLGNTLWMVDDQNAIADGVSIDTSNVWGAWILNGARLS